MNEEYCSNWPKWLRYLLVIPAAIIVWILAGLFLPFFFTFYLSRNSLAYEVIRSLAGGIGNIYCAQSILYTMPPKHKLWFVSVPSVLYFLIIIYDFIFYYSYGADWTVWLNLISSFITCIVMLCIFVKTEIENDVIQKYKFSNNQNNN